MCILQYMIQKNKKFNSRNDSHFDNYASMVVYLESFIVAIYSQYIFHTCKFQDNKKLIGTSSIKFYKFFILKNYV